MKKLLFICAFALFACKNNTDNDLNLTGNWVLQTSVVEYFDANNKKIFENSPSELQSLKNIEIKDGTLSIKLNEAKSWKGEAQKNVLDATVLPIILKYFTGKLVDNEVHLKWQTLTEANSDYFEIFKSTSGFYFKSLGKIKAKGRSDSLVNYSFLDNNPSFGTGYYKLSQVDFNGASTSSNVVLVEKNSIPFVPIKESDNYTIDLSPMTIAGFSKLGFTMPNPNTMVCNSTANSVAYTGCGAVEGVAHHASLKIVFVRE